MGCLIGGLGQELSGVSEVFRARISQCFSEIARRNGRLPRRSAATGGHSERQRCAGDGRTTGRLLGRSGLAQPTSEKPDLAELDARFLLLRSHWKSTAAGRALADNASFTCPVISSLNWTPTAICRSGLTAAFRIAANWRLMGDQEPWRTAQTGPLSLEMIAATQRKKQPFVQCAENCPSNEISAVRSRRLVRSRRRIADLNLGYHVPRRAPGIELSCSDIATCSLITGERKIVKLAANASRNRSTSLAVRVVRA